MQINDDSAPLPSTSLEVDDKSGGDDTRTHHDDDDEASLLPRYVRVCTRFTDSEQRKTPRRSGNSVCVRAWPPQAFFAQRTGGGNNAQPTWLSFEQLLPIDADALAKRACITECALLLAVNRTWPGTIGEREPALEGSSALLAQEHIRPIKNRVKWWELRRGHTVNVQKSAQFRQYVYYCSVCEFHLLGINHVRAHLLRKDHLTNKKVRLNTGIGCFIDAGHEASRQAT